ncbi:MAG: cupin domain-containing protein [Rhodobacterales bacterium]|nr:cupin domain-containing protein [Rhodobacterales bacterium]MDX5390072.1 cupin domain-containing protein [Rhodobacterales bacterium]MDX5489763.1 cupin domain-containing protein [Rhodobacterales bacterium]
MSDLFFPITPKGPAEVDRPAPDRVVKGDPVFTSWTLEDRDGLYCGIWESTPGAWRVIYDEWEYCRILSGVSILTEDGSTPVTLRAGDSFVLRPGFRGIWEVVETTRKDFVIRL